MTTYEIPLGYARPPLHANARYTRPQERRIIAETREAIAWRVKAKRIPPQDHITVGLVWQPRVHRRRDGSENLGPMIKAAVDAVVDAGVVRAGDDAPQYVTRRDPVILPPGARDRVDMWLVIETP